MIALHVLLACGGSTPTASVSPLNAYWGERLTVAETEQSHAPAILAFNDGRVLCSWVETQPDGVGMAHRVLTWKGKVSSSLPTLTLAATFLQSPVFVPALGDRAHLFWLDFDTDQPSDATRLWVTTLTPELRTERGTIRLTEAQTRHYTTAPAGNGAVWVVWSGGLPAAPSLSLRYLDGLGRPRPEQSLVSGGDWPALIWAENTLYLFWLGVEDGEVYRGVLQDGVLVDIVPLGVSMRLGSTDLLSGFTVGTDGTYFYLFWNITQVGEGMAQAWWTSGDLASGQMALPERAGVSLLDVPFETGFNGGSGQRAIMGDSWLSWAMPLKQPASPLPVVTQFSGQLGIVYFQDGEITGAQPVAGLEHPGLIGAPALMTDRSRHLYVAWSQPMVADGFAALMLISTRQ